MDTRYVKTRLGHGGTCLWFTAALLVLLPFSAAAQDASGVPEPFKPHPEADAAIEVLKSPYCPGMMLEVCSSAAGDALRDSLQALAYDGWTKDEIVDWVLTNHSDTLLALPPAEGRDLIAWIVPPLVFAMGLGVVLLALRVAKKKAGPDDVSEVVLTDEEEAALERALRELDEEEEPVF